MSLDQAFNWTKAPAGVSSVQALNAGVHPPRPPAAASSDLMEAAMATPRDDTGDDLSTPPPPSVAGRDTVMLADESPSVAMFARSPDLDFYVEAGPSRQRSPSPHRAEASSRPPELVASSSSSAPQPLPDDAWASLKSVLNSGYQSAQPRQAAKTLLALLSNSQQQTVGPSRFISRSMSPNDRLTIVNSLRQSPVGFQGALLDEVTGRKMLTRWLRDTIDEPEIFNTTRLPLLKFLDNAPILQAHLVDEATKNALAKAVGYVQKSAPAKAKALSTDIRARWQRIVNGEEMAPAAPTASAEPSASRASSTPVDQAPPSKGAVKGTAKRLAIEADDPRETKKGKTKETSQAPGSGSTIRPTNSDNMQSLTSLSQSSAYLSTLGRLGNIGSQVKPASTSKLSASGSERSSDLQSMAKKSVTRVDSDAKQICSKCKTPMIPGITSSTKIKPSAAAGKSITQICHKCQSTAKKTPATPVRGFRNAGRLALEDDDDSASSSSDSKIPSASKAPMRRPAASNDMFSSLLGKSDAKKTTAGKGPTAAGSKEASAPVKKPKKKVRWREDAELEDVLLIESFVDVDEETHADIETRGLHGLEMDEGSALRAAQHVDELEEEQDWYDPPLVHQFDPVPAERGSQSDESKKQEERERSVLSAVYMDTSEIPETPLEAIDMQPVDPNSEPQLIPPPAVWTLEDVSLDKSALNELMKQLRGSGDGSPNEERAGSSVGVPSGTSLEALGISSAGLQQLLGSIPAHQGASGSVGGDGEMPSHPGQPPAPYSESNHEWGPPQNAEQSGFHLPPPFGNLQHQQHQYSDASNQRPGRSNGRKKRVCTFWQKGQCLKGDACTFAHTY